MGLTSLMRSVSFLFRVSGSKILGTAAMMLITPKIINGKILLYTPIEGREKSHLFGLVGNKEVPYKKNHAASWI